MISGIATTLWSGNLTKTETTWQKVHETWGEQSWMWQFNTTRGAEMRQVSINVMLLPSMRSTWLLHLNVVRANGATRWSKQNTACRQWLLHTFMEGCFKPFWPHFTVWRMCWCCTDPQCSAQESTEQLARSSTAMCFSTNDDPQDYPQMIMIMSFTGEWFSHQNQSFTVQTESCTSGLRCLCLWQGWLSMWKANVFFLFFEPHKHQEQALRVSSSSIILSLYYKRRQRQSHPKNVLNFMGLFPQKNVDPM